MSRRRTCDGAVRIIEGVDCSRTSHDEDELEGLRHAGRVVARGGRVVHEEQVPVDVVGSRGKGRSSALLDEGSHQRLHSGGPRVLVHRRRQQPPLRHIRAQHSVAEGAARGVEREDGLRGVAVPCLPIELGRPHLPPVLVGEDAGVDGGQADGAGVVVGPMAVHEGAEPLRCRVLDTAGRALHEADAVVLVVDGKVGEGGQTAAQLPLHVHPVAVATAADGVEKEEKSSQVPHQQPLVAVTRGQRR